MAGVKTAVLISGNGSNLQALIEAAKDPAYPAEVTLVISNNPQAHGLERAKAANIPTIVVNHKDFAHQEDFEQKILQTLQNHDIQLVCLAGFMRILSAEFVRQWPHQILNIHPSLLPKYKGLHPQQQALEDNATESGCTVHIVTAEVDDGPIILQARVPIIPGDTQETLSARILKQEHRLYPKALRQIAEKS